MRNSIRGAIFDMDGTLVDSLFLWERLWEEFGKRYCNGARLPIREEDDRLIRTMILADAMEHVHRVCGIGRDGGELLTVAEEMIDGFYKNQVCLKDGVREFLEYCRGKGIRMMIASATRREYVEAAAKHCGIDGYFRGLISCADVGKGKEHPDVFLRAAKILGTEVSETCVFEDSLTALVTARDVGMKTVGIYDKYNYGGEALSSVADVYIAEGETLKKLIFKI